MTSIINMLKPLMVILVIATTSCSKNDDPTDSTIPPAPADDFIRSVDLSFLPEIELWNTTFYNNDSVEDNVLEVFKSAGGNTVRIRLWHNPSGIHSSLPEVTSFAKQVHDAGLKVWLNIHYSDTWADPGHQSKPASWSNIPYSDLVDSVAVYTAMVINAIQPELVQVGNETNHGFLWPDGERNNPKQFHELLKSGIDAARETKPDLKIMVHYAGVDNVLDYFQSIDSLDFDQIAISYYPKWHTKDLNELEQRLDILSSTLKRKVLLAEVAYPFTLGWNDWTNNIIGSAAEGLPQYPPSESNQAAYIGYLNRMMKRLIHGNGLSYWAPEWVAYKGQTATDGSPWENQALFNFNNVALPALDSLCQ